MPAPGLAFPVLGLLSVAIAALAWWMERKARRSAEAVVEALTKWSGVMEAEASKARLEADSWRRAVDDLTKRHTEALGEWKESAARAYAQLEALEDALGDDPRAASSIAGRFDRLFNGEASGDVSDPDDTDLPHPGPTQPKTGQKN